MFGSAPAIPPRPTTTEPCICIWRALQEQRDKVAAEAAAAAAAAQHRLHEQQEHDRTHAHEHSSLNPLNILPGAFFGRHNHHDDGESSGNGGGGGGDPELLGVLAPEEIAPTSPLRRDSRSKGGTIAAVTTAAESVGVHQSGSSSSPTLVGNSNSQTRILPPPIKGEAILRPTPRRGDIGVAANADAATLESPSMAVSSRAQKKGDALRKSGKGFVGKPRNDVLARQIKKRLSKSSENKLGDLISYREDLLNTLSSLIPLQRDHDSKRTHPPVIQPVPHTRLCATCQTNLAYSLYFSPSARAPYIRDHSTAAFLSLVDDATSALSCSLPLEPVTHHQLDCIMRAELAVAEWRIALKLARYHKRTGFLEMFPVRIGEYAELEVNKSLPNPSEGLLKKAGKSVLGAVGLGGMRPPPAVEQGAINLVGA